MKHAHREFSLAIVFQRGNAFQSFYTSAILLTAVTL